MKYSTIYYSKAILLITILGLIFCISSCESEIDIDLPEEAPKLVVNSIFNADSALLVNLTKSRSIHQGGFLYVNVENAVVDVFIDNTKFTSLQYKGNGNYLSPTVLPNKPKSKYSLEINTPEFKNAKSSGILPSKPVTGPALFSLNPISNNFDRLYDVTFELNDGPEEDFYELRLFDHEQNWEIPIDLLNNFNQFDQPTSSMGMVQFFNDKSFNGKKVIVDISFSFINSQGRDRKISLILKKLEKPYFEYHQSVIRYLDSDPVLNPARPVSSNIENAYGIFGLYNAQVMSTILK